MEIESLIFKASWILTLFYYMCQGELIDTALYITRYNSGDIFGQTQEGKTKCSENTCVGVSSGTATAISGKELCTCRCHSHLPAFREDLRICVDDIHECVLAPFVGGSTSQQIPFVFLPLKGQIIHPSKEISFAGIRTPVCAVSGAKFLTDSGWVDLRNPLDTDVPFRLFRDEGRTFLQWVGEPELRTKMSGRLVLVYLMCRDLDTAENFDSKAQTLFSPCVAFRVVGTPARYLSNVSEVAFLPDAHPSLATSENSQLSVSEYVAIGICSVLLGLIYVASVFLYLHLRKRNSRDGKDKSFLDNKSLATAEEGVVKSNPLLSMVTHFSPSDNVHSDTNSSDTDATPDILQHHDDKKKHMQITAALIHPQQQKTHFESQNYCFMEQSFQDSSSIERLPEENVSIIETLEGREDRPENLKALSSGIVRKKLYFNPAYFEHHLLLAPPPAALEFLAKIREVITIAKQKMATKKFTPSLLGIPEEHNYSLEPSYDFSKPTSRRSSIISLKRENSRRKTCSGCPGCEPQTFNVLCGKLPEFPSLGACHNCCNTNNDSKQRSIQKWLEDVPLLKSTEELVAKVNNYSNENCSIRNLKRIRSPTRSLPPDSGPERALSPKPASERGLSTLHEPKGLNIATKENIKQKKLYKPNTPPPPTPTKMAQNNVEENVYDSVPISKQQDVKMSFPPPDMIHEAMAVDNKSESIARIPTLTKKQMKAVINEFTNQRNLLVDNQQVSKKNIEYETDSLERSEIHKTGYQTPSDYAEVSSSQPSPSLSTALPMDEEMTMRNAIFNKKTGNMTISKINMDMLQEDEHDYELIVLKKGSVIDPSLYKLPELLQRNNGYSLVSEVYVNNGYNYGSTPSTPTDSNCSTLEKQTLKVRYENKPGKLLIEVEDCPDNYIPVNDSDSFEPDTLDRKPSKLKLSEEKTLNASEYVDSLERPNQILLRTTGSFRNDLEKPPETELVSGNFNRIFGSLREIYEAKTKGIKEQEESNFNSLDSEEGRLLTLEERHSKRQRRLNSGKTNIVQPDVIPPPPHDNLPIYEHPKPPRKIIVTDDNKILKPPLPPKNLFSRSARNQLEEKECCNENKKNCHGSALNTDTPVSTKKNSDYEFCVLQKSKKNGNITSLIQSEDIILKKGGNEHFVFHTTVTPTTYCLPMKSLQSIINPHQLPPTKKKLQETWKTVGKQEDSGYLSTDSNESNLLLRNKQSFENAQFDSGGGGAGSETDESLCDGHSESGAESVETHSVFFGSFTRKPVSYANYGSMDSGVTGEDDNHSSTDSETVSYKTTVPITLKINQK